MVSANLKNIESCYLKASGGLKIQNFSKGRAGRVRPKEADYLQRNTYAGKENMDWNYKSPKTNEDKARMMGTGGEPAQGRSTVKGILTRFRNKSLKTYKKSKYKARILSREKYINQRVNQMIKLNRR